MSTKNGSLGRVVKHIRRWATAGIADARPDRELLDRYITDRDEAAFAELVRRYGGLVFGIGQRMLRHAQDAEDAFQATFLVLARKASTIRKQESVGGWLYGVAFRVAKKSQAGLVRRRAREKVPAPTQRPASDEVSWRELQLVLDEELDRLADKYRAPLLLCCLEGKTRDEAAQQLGWPVGVLRGRIDRGRELLRARLLRRGITLSAALLTAGITESHAAVMHAALFSSTIQAALAPSSAVANIASAKVLALTQGVTQAMFVTKLKTLVAAFVTLAFLGTGAGFVSYHTSTFAGEAGPADSQAGSEAGGEVKQENDPAKLRQEIARLRLELEKTRRELRKAQLSNRLMQAEKVLADNTATERLQALVKAEQALLEQAKQKAALEKAAWVRTQEVLQAEIDALVQQAAARQQLQNVQAEQAKNNELRAKAAAALASIGKAAEKTPQSTAKVAAAAISPDATRVARSEDKMVVILDIKTGKVLSRSAVPAAVSALAFSPDGKVLASGGQDKSVTLWDTATGAQLRKIMVPNRVTAVLFTSDGRVLILRESDMTQREIDLSTGKEIRFTQPPPQK